MGLRILYWYENTLKLPATLVPTLLTVILNIFV